LRRERISNLRGKPQEVSPQADAQFLELPGIDYRRGAGHQVAGLLVLRESDHIADVGRAAEHHRPAIEPECDTAVRRSTALKRIEQEAEAGLRIISFHPEYLEHQRLHLPPVNPDAAAADLVAVQHEVVSLGPALARILLQ